eukprot:449414-Rhodomonas_salina.2
MAFASLLQLLLAPFETAKPLQIQGPCLLTQYTFKSLRCWVCGGLFEARAAGCFAKKKHNVFVPEHSCRKPISDASFSFGARRRCCEFPRPHRTNLFPLDPPAAGP